eukprot:301522-Chlamydomonas_euryale.AAC.3
MRQPVPGVGATAMMQGVPPACMQWLGTSVFWTHPTNTFKPDGCDIAKKAAAGDKIGVHYKGMLTSGKEEPPCSVLIVDEPHTILPAPSCTCQRIVLLAHDHLQFDSSYKRNRPFSFKLGGGQVIKGWDQGLMGACVGEKRLLKIVSATPDADACSWLICGQTDSCHIALQPPSLGYGEAGAGGVIPGGATLIFETEVTALD